MCHMSQRVLHTICNCVTCLNEFYILSAFLSSLTNAERKLPKTLLNVCMLVLLMEELVSCRGKAAVAAGLSPIVRRGVECTKRQQHNALALYQTNI